MIALAPLVAAAIAPSAPLHPGIWSSVHYSRESGDADGLELIVPSANATQVELTVCEGGCSPRKKLAIRRSPVGFSFEYVEDVSDQNGKPGILPPRHAQARFDGPVLVVLWLHEDSVDILRRRGRAITVPRDVPVLERPTEPPSSVHDSGDHG